MFTPSFYLFHEDTSLFFTARQSLDEVSHILYWPAGNLTPLDFVHAWQQFGVLVPAKWQIFGWIWYHCRHEHRLMDAIMEVVTRPTCCWLGGITGCLKYTYIIPWNIFQNMYGQIKGVILLWKHLLTGCRMRSCTVRYFLVLGGITFFFYFNDNDTVPRVRIQQMFCYITNNWEITMMNCKNKIPCTYRLPLFLFFLSSEEICAWKWNRVF